MLIISRKASAEHEEGILEKTWNFPSYLREVESKTNIYRDCRP